VQVTGGDPTLRDRVELVAIVRYLSDQGQRAMLMTNGIKASRPLLRDLRAAGLVDVAFHVDTTQERKGYAKERDLNALRLVYIETARGLGLSVMFNTTIDAGNLCEVASLARFFRKHAGGLRTVSFQLQTDTGRGILKARSQEVTPEGVWARINEGLGISLDIDSVRVGHSSCSRYGFCAVINDQAFDLLNDRDFVTDMQGDISHLEMPRGRSAAALWPFARWLLMHPRKLSRSIAWCLRHIAAAGGDLYAARGRVHTLSFITHNFMHACSLQRDRIDSCVFKTMTADGPLSMCLHTARRDEFITQAVTFADGRVFDPLQGRRGTEVSVSLPDPIIHGLKRARDYSKTGKHHERLLCATSESRQALALLPVFLVACCVQVRESTVSAPTSESSALASWSTVLEQFFDEHGWVKFKALATQRSDLDSYVAWIAAVSPHNHLERFTTPHAQLAHHINAYNALSMYNILQSGSPRSLSGLAKVNFFAFRKLMVGGR
jgi:hypothetical protein